MPRYKRMTLAGDIVDPPDQSGRVAQKQLLGSMTKRRAELFFKRILQNTCIIYSTRT